ncbi:13949_t:CDS:2, partial [Gigaspora margarita]
EKENLQKIDDSTFELDVARKRKEILDNWKIWALFVKKLTEREWKNTKRSTILQFNNLTSATQHTGEHYQDENSKESTTLITKLFRSLSHLDAEDLFRSIVRDTAVEINLPKDIENYLKNSLAEDIDSILTKVKEPLSNDAQPLLLGQTLLMERQFVKAKMCEDATTKNDP